MGSRLPASRVRCRVRPCISASFIVQTRLEILLHRALARADGVVLRGRGSGGGLLLCNAQLHLQQAITIVTAHYRRAGITVHGRRLLRVRLRILLLQFPKLCVKRCVATIAVTAAAAAAAATATAAAVAAAVAAVGWKSNGGRR